MKRLIMLAAICCVVVPVNGQQPGKHPNSQQKSPSTLQPPKSKTIDIDTVNINKLNVQQQTSPADNSEKDAKKPPSYLRRLIAPENLPNLILSAVGIAGIIVAVCTLGAIRRQANIALLNAQSVINSERAWLIPDARSVEPNTLTIPTLANTHVETINVGIENCGRTPAWLMDWFLDVIVLDDTNIGQYTDAQPEGDFPNARPFPQGRRENFSREWKTSMSEIAAIKSGQRHLYVWGFLQYRNLTGDDPCISRFCLHYFHRRNTLGRLEEGWAAEPSEENHYT
jgi:hypothetical protein